MRILYFIRQSIAVLTLCAPLTLAACAQPTVQAAPAPAAPGPEAAPLLGTWKLVEVADSNESHAISTRTRTVRFTFNPDGTLNLTVARDLGVRRDLISEVGTFALSGNTLSIDRQNGSRALMAIFSMIAPPGGSDRQVSPTTFSGIVCTLTFAGGTMELETGGGLTLTFERV